MNRGDAQSREAEGRLGGNLDFTISTSVGGIPKEPDSVNRGEPVVQREEAPTAQRASNANNQIPLTQNPGVSSNTSGGARFQTPHFTGGGHAFGTNSTVNNNNTFTIIRSGDGQFTESQRNLVHRSYTSQSKANPMCVDM
ncbi:hypothetical protein M378DRAFT_170287 [Amanita muscaria Koide BX008]|uniref:Uncharacterized protein n=1 Tax=Amanita muscaria (strain Koide BX008) TaxID=946122 RepID=A0A0C2WQU6_AMAMK|nr:hypothetical protein M378DRAFT_170287 [Amanita muscaria Koide BX008]